MTGDLSPLNLALLGLLNRAEATGYELMRIFAETPLGGYSSSPGAIYPALRKLKKAGLVAVAGEGASGRGARLTATPQGLAALTAWIQSPPAPGPGGIVDISGEMLKFSFAGDVLSVSGQLDFLDRFERALADGAGALRAAHRDLQDRLNMNDLLAVEAGLMNYETAIAWCGRARAVLSAGDEKKQGRRTS